MNPETFNSNSIFGKLLTTSLIPNTPPGFNNANILVRIVFDITVSILSL